MKDKEFEEIWIRMTQNLKMTRTEWKLLQMLLFVLSELDEDGYKLGPIYAGLKAIAEENK